jgi:hypothetical protein
MLLLMRQNIADDRIINYYHAVGDRLCGLVVRVPGYRSWGPGSISGGTKFSKK